MFVVLFSSCAVVCVYLFFLLSFDFLPQTHGLLVRGGTGGESGMGTLQVGPELRPCVPCLEHGHRHITGTRCFIQGKHSVCYSFFSLTHPPSHTFSPVLATSFASVSKVLDKHRFCIGLLTKMYLASYCDYLRSSEYY